MRHVLNINYLCFPLQLLNHYKYFPPQPSQKDRQVYLQSLPNNNGCKFDSDKFLHKTWMLWDFSQPITINIQSLIFLFVTLKTFSVFHNIVIWLLQYLILFICNQIQFQLIYLRSQIKYWYCLVVWTAVSSLSRHSMYKCRE